jgi:hypothetical protein
MYENILCMKCVAWIALCMLLPNDALYVLMIIYAIYEFNVTFNGIKVKGNKDSKENKGNEPSVPCV